MTFENDKPDYGLTKPAFRGFRKVSIAPNHQHKFSDTYMLGIVFYYSGE